MSPFPCEGCFLYERSGGVCPPARETYGVEDAAAAERLRAAVRQDAESAESLAVLAGSDAERGAAVGALSPSELLGLPAAPAADSVANHTRKEMHHVVVSRSPR